ncbi:MAG: hypothetical protein AAGL69_08075 [Pseudomonadota bacterium]
MRCVSTWMSAIAALAVCSVNVDAQMFDQEEQIVDEVVSIGTRPSGFAFGWLGSWLSWSILDIDNLNGDLDSLGASLQNLIDAANEASEELCRRRIEDWRSSCHARMNTNRHLCVAASSFLLGAPIAYLLPSVFRRGGYYGVGLVGYNRCAQWDFRAHQHCDAIADSGSAPRIAQCDGTGGN